MSRAPENRALMTSGPALKWRSQRGLPERLGEEVLGDPDQCRGVGDVGEVPEAHLGRPFGGTTAGGEESEQGHRDECRQPTRHGGLQEGVDLKYLYRNPRGKPEEEGVPGSGFRSRMPDVRCRSRGPRIRNPIPGARYPVPDWRRGWDLNPRDRKPGPTVFETAAFGRSATPPGERYADARCPMPDCCVSGIGCRVPGTAA